MTGSEGNGQAADVPRLLDAKAVLRVLTVSDWHIGSGAGAPGGIDAMIRRDADGLPYIPGTTLTGVLRDACEQVALAMDSGISAQEPTVTPFRRPWFQWVTYLFGARVGHESGPKGAVVSIRPALASEQVRLSLVAGGQPAGVAALRAATTFVKPGVKVAGASGRAEDHMLRMAETARAGLALHASVSVHGFGALSTEQRRAATVLLVLGTAWLRALGADRNRGSGEIQARIQALVAEQETEQRNAAAWKTWVTQCLDWAHATTPESVPKPPESDPPSATALRLVPSVLDNQASADGDSAGWVFVPLTITTVDPIRVPRRTLGNLITGRDYIPGSTLLPWLLSRAADAAALRAALVTGDAVITNATPDVAGQRGRHVPFALLGAKRAGADDGLVNALMGGQANKPLHEGWLTGEVARGADGTGTVDIVELTPTVVTHNVATPLAGRPTTVDGGVYTVEAIPARTVLRAELRVRESVVDEVVQSFKGHTWTALAGAARIGSRTASEYGRVTVEVGDQAPVRGRSGLVANDEFTIWTQSDVLVRDGWLRLSGDPHDVISELARQLEAVSGAKVSLEILASHTRATRTESWQRAWGLPRATLVGLAAGSCLRLKLTLGAVSAEQLAVVCACGIGERRGEGFGQLEFISGQEGSSLLGWTGPLRRRAVKAGPVSIDGAAAGRREMADPADEKYLELVRGAAFSRVLADLIRERAGVGDTQRNLLMKALADATSTQRGQLRSVVAALRSPAGIAALDTYFSTRASQQHHAELVDALTQLRAGQLEGVVEQARARLGMTQPPADAALSALGLLVLDVLAEIDAEPGATADDTRQRPPRQDTAVRATPPQPRTRPTTKGVGDRRSSRPSAPSSAPSPDVEFRPVHTRYELALTFLARTPLHVGGSHGDPYVDLTVATNGRGEPYVPGSSLAGALRSRWSRLCGEDRTTLVWDGVARIARWRGDKREQFFASLVEVADAPLVACGGAGSPRLEVRDGVGIDRFTAAAAHRIKYDREVVPAGTTLDLRMIAEDCEPVDPESGRSTLYDEIERFAADLADHRIALGAATTRGLGRLAVKPGTTVTLTRCQVGGRAGILDAIRHVIEPAQPSEPVWTRQVPEDSREATTPPPGVLRVEIGWCAEGPLLVGASLRAENAALVPLVSAHPDTGQPVPVMPGSSVKGVFRAEAERTLRTVFAPDMPPGRPSFVNQLGAMAVTFPALAALFGSQDRRGALSVPDTYAKMPPDDAPTWATWDAYLSGEQTAPPATWAHEVTRTAIDRWTGGAADGLLYTTLEPHGLGWEPLRLDIDLVWLRAALTPGGDDAVDVGSAGSEREEMAQRRVAAALALFLYCVASFTDGRLPLGHGGNRGLGQVRVRTIGVALGGKADGMPLLPEILHGWQHTVAPPPLLHGATDGPSTVDRRLEVLSLARALCVHSGILGTWTDYLIDQPERTDSATNGPRQQGAR